MKQTNEILLDLKLPKDAQQAVEKPLEEAKATVVDLQKELLVLRLAFGKLKVAISNAVAPVAAVFVPMITRAVWAATRMVKVLGQVAASLLGITANGKKVEKTTLKMGKSANRSLASFDQLNRLNKSTGSQTVTTVTPVEIPVSDVTAEKAQAIVDKINLILAPLREVEPFPIILSLTALREEFSNFATVVGEVMGALWNDHLAPFMVWIADHLVPALTFLATSALALLRVELSQVGTAFLSFLEQIKPVTDFLKQTALTVINQVRQLFNTMRKSVEQDGSALAVVLSKFGTLIRDLWNNISPALSRIRETFCQVFQVIGTTVFTAMESVLQAVDGVIDVLSGLLTGNWKKIWNGLADVVKGAVNAMIGVLNAMISGLVGALNTVINLFNKMKIKVPDWVPGMGGKVFGFDLKTISAPKIPYLAKGAVLPANQPFLAMVGDQKHGTNIEAPLATIQEAVALVMQDQVEAMMAGFNALLQENRQLRHTVEGIEVGDSVIGRAAQRYNRRQAVIRGGVL